MARSRSRGTLVDYLVAAIEPALIMIMVGSLMFFLLDLWYTGESLARLRWIMFWFVLGIVMITRVSMQIGNSLAQAYGLALGGSVALVASRFVGFQPVLLVILGVVWWVTHKLTFDCTLIDQDQDAGVGLLQESGLDRRDLADEGPPPPADDPWSMEASLLPTNSRPKVRERDAELARRPNAPGVWLVYFTLASLPVFGLGQWLVPAVEEDRRASLFVYFIAYIFSGMGLLLATSFLNLRRYLRQRKLKMPAAMTATWLTTGTVLIVGLTLLAAALPLPRSKPLAKEKGEAKTVLEMPRQAHRVASRRSRVRHRNKDRRARISRPTRRGRPTARPTRANAKRRPIKKKTTMRTSRRMKIRKKNQQKSRVQATGPSRRPVCRPCRFKHRVGYVACSWSWVQAPSCSAFFATGRCCSMRCAI
jgi:hypothetical protein